MSSYEVQSEEKNVWAIQRCVNLLLISKFSSGKCSLIPVFDNNFSLVIFCQKFKFLMVLGSFRYLEFIQFVLKNILCLNAMYDHKYS